eukprot:m.130192 g.130192  ORF g.130192 m.130192 type:complete len:302 (-) comp15714_c2_seq12:155-1060(-)
MLSLFLSAMPGLVKLNPRLFSNEDAVNCLIPMGVTSENVAERYTITRQQQDAFAAESHRRAAKAQADGTFDREIVPTPTQVLNEDGELVSGPVITRDDGVRADTTAESLSKLRPAFKQGGSTTAGNSSQVTDGAAAVLLASRRKARQLGLSPRARIVAYAVCGVPPDVMGIGPAVAIPKVLEKANMSIDDIDVFEINEAFASQVQLVLEVVADCEQFFFLCLHCFVLPRLVPCLSLVIFFIFLHPSWLFLLFLLFLLAGCVLCRAPWYSERKSQSCGRGHRFRTSTRLHRCQASRDLDPPS